jgi:two-component system chemotaxis sensor kinase CheA
MRVSTPCGGPQESGSFLTSLVDLAVGERVLMVNWKFGIARKLAARGLGKEIEVTIEPNEMRLCADTLSPVWSVLSHVIRNAIDHGIESRDERVQNGKEPSGRVRLGTRVSESRISIEVSDGGRGVAWDSVAVKAKAKNLPFGTAHDLIEALFADGLSTKEVATDISGRGVGMCAVRQTCRELGGDVQIESEPGKGTTVRCSFPEQAMSGRSTDPTAGRAIIQSYPPQVDAGRWPT